MKLMVEAQYVIIPTSVLPPIRYLHLRKEGKTWNMEGRDLLRDTGTVQETDEARYSNRDGGRRLRGK